MCFRPFCRNGVAGGMLSQAPLRCISQRIRIGRGTQELDKGTGEGQVFLDWESGQRIGSISLAGFTSSARASAMRVNRLSLRRVLTFRRSSDLGQRVPRADNYTRFREMTKAIFWVFGKRVREITSREETERPPENRLGRSQHAPASQEPKARWRSGSADRT